MNDVRQDGGAVLGMAPGLADQIQANSDKFAQMQEDPKFKIQKLIDDIAAKCQFLREVEYPHNRKNKKWINKDALIEDIIADLQEYKAGAEGFNHD